MIDQRDRLVHVERLGQVIERAALKGGYGAVQVGKGGHHDDRQTGMALFKLAQQLQAVATGHADIGHQCDGRFARQRFQHVGRLGETAGGDTSAGQGLFEDPADGLVVVDDRSSRASSLYREN